MQITSIRYLSKIFIDVKAPPINIVKHNLPQTIVHPNDVEKFCMDETIIKEDRSK